MSIETGSGVKRLKLFLRDGRVSSVTVDMGKANFDPSSLPAVAYLYIDGDTLTMAVMAALDSGILTAMANNYRLNGSAASPQL